MDENPYKSPETTPEPSVSLVRWRSTISWWVTRALTIALIANVLLWVTQFIVVMVRVLF